MVNGRGRRQEIARALQRTTLRILVAITAVEGCGIGLGGSSVPGFEGDGVGWWDWCAAWKAWAMSIGRWENVVG